MTPIERVILAQAKLHLARERADLFAGSVKQNGRGPDFKEKFLKIGQAHLDAISELANSILEIEKAPGVVTKVATPEPEEAPH